ncbi:ACR238Wp [Eremothecium gossypii ATCC 10895]|uniref:ACR238Wp n=1 Tax=Eremothecium gossypii (strain ATCC 10895 / CBS 109.51 / FGSC 9923 / NRRL Y-1056) TaxID=284811 RepID=Q75BN3_EREGS|nr:ACR238Wp [Eremothecium gossypii ATCC 10895]AAS51464.1 ACR238Wp [Eremothecium gossypii ATCC 10895]
MSKLRYYDIAVNLADPMFQGVYRGKARHGGDLAAVLERCRGARVDVLLATGSSLAESAHTRALVREYAGNGPRLLYTAGVHPCCADELARPGALAELRQLWAECAGDETFRALGEMGLDYDRLEHAGRPAQLRAFEAQLRLSCEFAAVPLFLHMRASCADFIEMMGRFVRGFTSADELDEELRAAGARGANASGRTEYRFAAERKMVVHSFTGTAAELDALLALSPHVYIGLNGASLRTAEGLENARRLPLQRLLLETDAPWCEIRRTHAAHELIAEGGPEAWREAYPDLTEWYESVRAERLDRVPEGERAHTMVRSRNEPCAIGQVAVAVARARGVLVTEVAEAAWQTACAVYGS